MILRTPKIIFLYIIIFWSSALLRKTFAPIQITLFVRRRYTTILRGISQRLQRIDHTWKYNSDIGSRKNHFARDKNHFKL